MSETAKLMTDAGLIVICSIISPYRIDREKACRLFQNGEFIEIYLRCPLSVCKSRDQKGLYKKAETGIINNFTGINDIYEEPLTPEITIDTDKYDIEQCADMVIRYLDNNDKLIHV
jgi:adenylylsulfate kinase